MPAVETMVSSLFSESFRLIPKTTKSDQKKVAMVIKAKGLQEGF
jgi:hypothetical protein